jgi:hypothetical protein
MLEPAVFFVGHLKRRPVLRVIPDTRIAARLFPGGIGPGWMWDPDFHSGRENEPECGKNNIPRHSRNESGKSMKDLNNNIRRDDLPS